MVPGSWVLEYNTFSFTLTEGLLLSNLELSGLGVKNESTGDTLNVYGSAQRTLSMSDVNLVEGEDALWHAVVTVPLKDGDGTVYKYYAVEKTPVPGGEYDITYDGQAQGLGRNGTVTITNQVRPVEIQIIKTDARTGEAIGGAVFSIQADRQDLSFRWEDGKLVPADAGTVTEFTVPEGGVTVKGLRSGSYTLFEKKAPDGYVITDNETAFTVRKGKVYMGGEEADQAAITVPNPPGPALPNTGGPTPAMFYLMGILLTGVPPQAF